MELNNGTESIRIISIINGSNRIIPKLRKPNVRISSDRRDQSHYLQFSREFYFPQAMQFIPTHNDSLFLDLVLLYAFVFVPLVVEPSWRRESPRHGHRHLAGWSRINVFLFRQPEKRTVLELNK
jgi:hypothetical protein